MNEKLQAKVCYNLMSVLGFVKLTNPEGYDQLWDIEKSFTEDEIKIINAYANKSEEHVNAVKQMIEMLKGMIDG